MTLCTSLVGRTSRLMLLACLLLLGSQAPALASTPDSEVPAPDADQAPPDEAAQSAARFDIFEFRVLGNTVLPMTRIEQVLYPFLGPSRGASGDFERIQAAQAALAAEYKQAGYAAASIDVPEQNINNGIVRLLVVEGTVDHLRITGARYVSGRQLGKRLPSLRAGQVFHLPSAQTEISALGSESRRITPALQAGSRPGTVDVELMVDDKLPLRAGLTLSNAASANTTKTRLNGEVGYSNLFQRDHSFNVSYQLTPEEPSEVNALVGTYIARFRDSRDVLAVYGVRTDSDVSALGDINVLGRGKVLGARYIHPLAAPAGATRSVSFGVDYKDFDDTTSLGSAELLSDIQYWKALLSFNAGVRRERSLTQFNVGVDVAMRHAGNRRREFEDKRFKGEPDFFYLTAGVHHEQLLPWDAWRATVDVSLRLTEDPLISNEQWAMGGQSTVRGYLESEGLMDWGVGARVALLTPGIGVSDSTSDSGWRSLVRSLDGRLYVDWQGGFLHEPLPNQNDHLYLLSTGIGVSVVGVHGWFSNLDLALPLRDGPFTDAYEPRLLFEFGYDLQ